MNEHPVRLVYLDSLRGLAALSVVASHFVIAYGLPPALEFLSVTPLHALWHGDGAVSFFFILSGFVLALPYVRSRKKYFFLPYSLSRFFRIVPLLFFAVTLSLVLSRSIIFQSFTTHPQASGWILWFWHQPLSFRTLLTLVPQAWTLTIELPVSICIPLLTLFMRKKRYIVPAAVFIFYFLTGLPSYLFDFILGILLAMHLEKILQFWKRSKWFVRVSFPLLGLFLYTASFTIPKELYIPLNRALLNIESIGCVLILVSILSSQTNQRIFSARVLTYLGKISYSIYLMHFIVLLCFTPWVVHLLNTMYIQDEYLTRVLGFCATIGVTIALSSLTFQYVEKPGIQIGRYVVGCLKKVFTLI